MHAEAVALGADGGAHGRHESAVHGCDRRKSDDLQRSRTARRVRIDRQHDDRFVFHVTQSVSTGTISSKPNGHGIPLSFGLTCTYAATNTCGFGGVVPVSSSQALGVSAILKGFTGSGTVTGGTVSLNGYTGAPGGLTLAQGSGDRWTISGGTLVVAQKGTFDETVNAKSLNVDGKLAVQDAGNNAAVTLSFGTRTGIKNGDVSSISPAKLYSTFSTDETGTGAIAYSEGPAARIVFFIITG